MPIWSSWPTCILPAKRRSRKSIATIWCRVCVPAAIVNVAALESSERLASMIRGIAAPGDMVICLGAGSITQWAYALPGELQALG